MNKKNSQEKSNAGKGENCTDKKCPRHGGLSVRGRQFTGVVVSTKMRKTAIVEWEWQRTIPKFERYEKRNTNLKVHNPACIDAKEGDVVRVHECRPLSKSKSFVIVEKTGSMKGFHQKMEARLESKKTELRDFKKEEIKEEETKSEE